MSESQSDRPTNCHPETGEAATSTHLRDASLPTVAAPLIDISAELVPERIGNYRILGKIGEGGMGSVYEAEQENPRRRVALKVIRAGFISMQLLRRFELEAQVLGRLQHPGIAQVYEAGTADAGQGPQPFFAMEYVDGLTLMEYVSARKLDTRERLELVARICDAVQHAHQKGVIHRDLKPGNILVVDEESTATMTRGGATRTRSGLAGSTLSAQPKILDFGIARATDSDIQVTTMHTDIGQLIGTIPYMSPEQVSGDPQLLDTRSDVYALGVIAYEVLAGQLPYEVRQKIIPEAVRIIREDDPSPLSSINRTFRGDVETIVAKSLEKDKLRRYQSAAELADDIRRYLRDEPIVARPPSTLYQIRKFARRNKSLVGGVIAVFVVLIAGMTISTGQYLKAAAARDEARRERDRAVEAEKLAEENFRMAGEAVTKYFTTVGDSPDLKARGLEPLRRQLLETARDFYERFVQQRANDPALRRELADALINLGNIDRSIGEMDKAEAAHLRAREIGEALGAQAPTEPAFVRLLAIVHANLGLLYADISRSAEAEAAYRRAIELESQLADIDPRNAADQARWANAYDNFGILLFSKGRIAESEDAYRKGMEIREQLTQDNPGNSSYQQLLAHSYINLAQLLAMTGRTTDAEPVLIKAVPIVRRLVHENPDVPDYQRALAATYSNLAGVYILSGKLEQAGDTYRRSLSTREKLAREHPLVLEYTLEVGSVYCNLGELDTRLGRADASLASFAVAIENMEEVLNREPRHATGRYYLSYTHSWRARALADLSRWKDALADWNRAVELDDRNNPILLAGRAFALAATGDLKAAAAVADKVLDNKQLDEEGSFFLAAVYAMDAARRNGELRAGVRAMELLKRASDAGFFRDPENLRRLRHYAAFDGLRTTDPFIGLMRQLDTESGAQAVSPEDHSP